ncbi:hypothetical protein [Agromyces larvae]|uniref:DNA polymerase III subunit gamma/tau n=1 Tax=Agromyces larvae TaxID=2929802 RepID=A0ABY4C1T2_9MICO|nr:hypothetical protein [Agromyces larvae]UOE45441.1 hypothetical protein MTO99_06700 [Agromyces larvae]
MATDSDEEAFRWEGDDDPTLAPGWKVVGGPASRETQADAEGAAGGAIGDESPSAWPTSSADPTGRPTIGSLELVVLGVLGGVYLLYTVGWLVTVVRTDAPGTSVLGDLMYGLGLWLAVLAPALWFALVFALVRRAPLRLLWLAVGALLLVPLPFVLGVTA